MKKILLKNILFNNTLLKIICLIIGYSFWYVTSYDTLHCVQWTVPLCFTQLSSDYCIDAPETITITLQGKRADLYHIETKTLAAHINIDNFAPGEHPLIIEAKNLFLPKSITLIRYKPSNLSFTLSKT